MKKTLTIITALSMIVFILSGCQKQPTASFSTDKESYTGGETVILTNESIDGKSYVWTVSDGQTSTDENYNYTTSYEQSGTITFELTAYSRNGKKESSMTKSVTVTPAKGDVTFWISEGTETTVTFQGSTETITTLYSEKPDCGAAGCANFTDLDAGTYTYSATNGSRNWNGNIIVFAGKCSKLELTLDKSKTIKDPIASN